MTKEEKIKNLAKEQIELKCSLQDQLLMVDNLRRRINTVTKEINWLSHCIRNPSMVNS